MLEKCAPGFQVKRKFLRFFSFFPFFGISAEILRFSGRKVPQEWVFEGLWGEVRFWGFSGWGEVGEAF